MKVVKLEDCINEIKSLDNFGVITRSTNHICEDMRNEVKEFDAIPIPGGATNGDMIKAMFPNAIDKKVKPTNKVHFMDDFKGELYGIGVISLDWWNAPYKTEKWVNFAEELKDVFEEEVE